VSRRLSAGQRARVQAAHNPDGGLVDDTDQMHPLELLSDIDLDQLVAGEVPPGRNDLVALSAALGALRARVDAEPVPAMAPGLRIQLAEADADVDPATRSRPGLAVVPPAAEVGGWARWRGAVGASAAALVLVAGVGVAAAQNALPSAVQDALAASAQLVGIDLPRSHDRHGPPTGTPGGAGPAGPGSPGVPATPADPPAHGRGGQTGASARDGSPSGDAPGQTDGSSSDSAPGPDRGADPGPATAPEPAVDPHRDGPPSGDEPAGQDRSGGDDGHVPAPGDAPTMAPDSGDGGSTPDGPAGDGPAGGGPSGGGPSGPAGPPQSGGGGQDGPTPVSGEGSASAAAGAADR
jgi:hypothetical protein